LENKEGIESGAFWFYRKLGFRPVRREAAALCRREEARMRRQPEYRSPAGVLEKLAASPMVREPLDSRPGEWDRFAVRRIGLALERRMAERFGGDPDRMRRAAVTFVSRTLGADPGAIPARARQGFEDLALVFSLVDGLARWSPEEKAAAGRIMLAKSAPDEARYLRLMQRHSRLRAALLELGSRP
jgi:hypothetical protein